MNELSSKRAQMGMTAVAGIKKGTSVVFFQYYLRKAAIAHLN